MRDQRREAEDWLKRSAEAGFAEGADNLVIVLYQRDADPGELIR